MTDILVVDDEPELVVTYLRHAFPQLTSHIRVAYTGKEGISLAAERAPDIILLDVCLPDCSGLEVFAQLQLRDDSCTVVFITASETADTAIEAMKRGAFDYLYKPLDLDRFKQIVGDALEMSRLVRSRVRTEEEGEHTHDVMVGRCSAVREVYKSIGRVAAKNVIVLITGESGTGKELAARAVYQHSHRADKPFLAINSAAIPEALLESELFGHEKGAFTGAERRRIGKFEQCNGGTLFLDEIGDMPLSLQSKILRVLQNQTFERLGGNETIRTDVRLIAATHHDLNKRVESGLFRADLYYRLSVFTIRLPPLRERLDDLPLLVQHYLKRFNKELGKEVREVPEETLRILTTYHWPGNIRELQSVLKQALLRATGPQLLPAYLPDHVQQQLETTAPAETVSAAVSPLERFIHERLRAGCKELHAETLLFTERVLLPLVLEHTKGNQAQAAEILGVTRRTLRNRLRDLAFIVTHTLDSGEIEEPESDSA